MQAWLQIINEQNDVQNDHSLKREYETRINTTDVKDNRSTLYRWKSVKLKAISQDYVKGSHTIILDFFHIILSG